MSPQTPIMKVILPPTSQATGIRTYLNPIHVWPLNNRKARLCIDHIRQILDTLASERPETSAKINLHHGDHQKHQVALCMTPDDRIPLDVQNAENDMQTFAQLKAAYFPPSTFVGPRFKYDCSEMDEKHGVPAMRVLAVIIDGGVILSWHFHHSLFDLEGMRVVFSIIGSIAAGDGPICRAHHPKSLDMSFAAQPGAADNAVFPEYILPSTRISRHLGNPFDGIPLGCAIFQFRNGKLQELQDLLHAAVGGGDNFRPSTMLTLTVLTWAHVSKARNQAEQKTLPSSDPEIPQLAFPVTWRKRVTFDRQSLEYFGNACLMSISTLPNGFQKNDSEATTLHKAMAAMEKTLTPVDEATISARHELFASQEDARAVKSALDPANRNFLLFNCWEIQGGADLVLGAGLVPGLLGDGRPAAVRRGMAGWTAGGHTVMLPSRIDSGVRELMVVLPRVSLMAMYRDGAWMRWVDRVLW